MFFSFLRANAGMVVLCQIRPNHSSHTYKVGPMGIGESMSQSKILGPGQAPLKTN